MTVVYSIQPGINNTAEQLESLMKPLGGIAEIVNPGDRVLIKPNLVAPFPHAVTDFKLLTSLVSQVRGCGGEPIIGESSGFEFDTETTFKILGIEKWARRLDVRFINFDEERFVPITLEGCGRQVRVPKIVLETDKLINVPKLKRHSLTKATVGIKNLFGMLDYDSRRRLHAFGLERGISALGQTIIPDLVIVDGSVVTTRAVYGRQTRLNLLVAGRQMTSVDVFCCRYLGLNWETVEHIRLSVDREPNCLPLDTIDVSAKNRQVTSHPDGYSPPSIEKWSDSLPKKIHRLGYQAIYFVDLIYSRVRKNHSIIPLLHYYFGIRPVLKPDRCNACGDCLPACPVNAIFIDSRRIDAKRCMPVRCLECVYVCPQNAISVRGRNVDPNMIKQKRTNA